MDRRRFIALGVALPFGRCFRNDRNTERSRSDSHETATPEPTAEFGTMAEGTTLLEVVVDEAFSGEVLLRSSCREDQSLSAGECTELRREVDGEECEIRILVDGNDEFEATVFGSESYRATVNPNGEVDVTHIVV